MKKGTWMGVAAGMLIGAALMVTAPVYGAAKQYVLTLFEKPVIVNGVKYADAANPVLNYNGHTYIPLAKIGDLTGVQYRWNEAKQQVEIGSDGQAVDRGAEGSQTTRVEIDNENTVADDEVPANSGGTNIPIQTADPEPGYKGHADSEDPSYQWAVGEGEALPPLMSEGWISTAMLHEIASVYFEGTGTPHEAKLVTGAQWNETIFHTFKLTDDFFNTSDGDFVIDGFHIKKFDNTVFFNISELEKAGIL